MLVLLLLQHWCFCMLCAAAGVVHCCFCMQLLLALLMLVPLMVLLLKLMFVNVMLPTLAPVTVPSAPLSMTRVSVVL